MNFDKSVLIWMPAFPIKIWTGRPVLHIAVPCDEKEPPMVHTMHQKTPKKKKEKKVFTWAIWGSWSFSLITVMPEVRIGSQTGTRTWVSLLTSSDTCEGHADNVTYKYLAQHNSSNNIHDTIYRIWLVESNPVLMQKQGNKRQIFQRIAHCDWLMKNSNT